MCDGTPSATQEWRMQAPAHEKVMGATASCFGRLPCLVTIRQANQSPLASRKENGKRNDVRPCGRSCRTGERTPTFLKGGGHFSKSMVWAHSRPTKRFSLEGENGRGCREGKKRGRNSWLGRQTGKNPSASVFHQPPCHVHMYLPLSARRAGLLTLRCRVARRKLWTERVLGV